jgi:signal transduction histidine kinase
MSKSLKDILGEGFEKETGLVAFMQPLLIMAFEQQMLKEEPDAAYLSSAELLKFIIPYLPIKMAMTDSDFKIICATELWKQDQSMKCLSSMIQPNIENQQTVASHTLLWAYANQALKGQYIKDNCFEWRDSQNNTKWMKLEMQPWKLSKKQVEGIIIFTEDLTELKKRENLLNDLKCFAYMCPHDLKSSVRILNSFLTLLSNRRGDHKDDTEKQYFDFMFKALRTTTEIIDHSLQSVTLNGEATQTKEVSLDEIISTIIEEIQPLLDEKKATLCKGDLGVVNADFVLLKRVFLNLITNALQFASEPKIEIYSQRTQTHTEVFIKDNGIGIEKDFQNQIFDTYVKGDTTDTSSSGLGLSYCRKILRLWGAEISVNSTPGQGSIFTLIFPHAMQI